MNDTNLATFTRTAEQAANQVIACYSTSFGAATRLLGPRHRQHIRNIYALVRVADELVDGVATEAGLTLDEQRVALDRFVEQTHRAVASGYSSDLVIHAFCRTARACGIDATLIDPFFDSMRADLVNAGHDGPAAFDADAHDSYVHGSAEVVGLMCLRVFIRDQAHSPDQVLRLEHGARQLGAAFQDVNFLRDLADDTSRLGRAYLGTSTRITTADRDDCLRRIRGQLADAEAVVPLLPRDARSAVRSAAALFSALADRVEVTSVDELYRRRVRVPDATKAAIIARAVTRTLKEGRP
ncbi:squalene/phytoene synthase family protein [Tessaracoccus sp. SD287]|uniref:phytoene/squalene synthase family protein n=1 Tax=Tessaracoccus sp. SD287 TaxID=2782008 RepID=UPI001A96DCE2|nr:squalene/phytoene synthase family protein [Tessaracoccus sp. SD287]